jgi:hypothetical protein
MGWSGGKRSPCHRPQRNTPFPGSTFGESSDDDIVQIARRVDSKQFCAASPRLAGPRLRACVGDLIAAI